MNLQESVMVDGVEWKLFAVDFKSPDGRYSAYLYAIDLEHASYQVESMSGGVEIRELVAS
jgi:hypothetical protein